MNVAGFEALVIGQELQQPSRTLHPAFIFLERAGFLILTCVGPAAQIRRFGVAGLMFNSRDAQELTTGLTKRGGKKSIR